MQKQALQNNRSEKVWDAFNNGGATLKRNEVTGKGRSSVISAILLSFCFFLLAAFAEASTIGRPMNNNGLVGYWDFNIGKGGPTVYDRSGNGNNGTLTNATGTSGFSDGVIGQGVYLDGNDDYVDLGSDSSLRPSGSMTLCAWAELWHQGTSAHNEIISNDGNTGARGYSLYRYSLDSSNDAFVFLIASTSAAVISVSSVTRAGNANAGMYHICGVFDASLQTMNIYVNGVVEGTKTRADNVPSFQYNQSGFGNPKIGARGQGGDAYKFEGKIDEVRIYNRALSSNEVKRLYNMTGPKLGATPTVVSDGLVGHWTFDGSDMDNGVEDRSPYGNNGSLVNFTSTTTVIGKIGQALNFDGSNDYVSVPYDPSLNLPDSGGTVMGWFNFKTKPGQNNANAIFWKTYHGNTANTNGIQLKVYQGGPSAPMYLSGRLGGSPTQTLTSTKTQIQIDTWYHGVLTWDSDTMFLFLNGLEEASTTRTSTINLPNSTPTLLGRTAGTSGEYGDGSLDDIRAYNRELSVDEINRIYNATRPSSQNVSRSPGSLNDGLVGHWTFDGPTMSTATATDSSGQGNNGTRNGTSPVLGKLGQALSFDGVDDFVVLPSSAMGVMAEGSVSIFAKTAPSFSGNPTLRLAFGANTLSRVYIGHNSTGGLYVNRAGTVFGSHQLEVSTWYQFTLVWRTNNTAEIFVDGVSRGTASGLNLTGNISSENIGSYNSGGNSHWNGLIDDVRVYNRALSPDEIKRLYNLGN